MKKEIKTSAVPAVPGLLSQAIESDGWLMTSGQIHLTADGKLIKGTMKEKAIQVMENLKAIITAAGMDFSHVLKVAVYVTDMNEYSQFNDVYVTYFKSPFPAREVVCVKKLPLGASVEVSMVAKK